MKLCLVKISSGFFVIYRLGFLSDLEHRVWNADEDSQDGLEFAAGHSQIRWIRGAGGHDFHQYLGVAIAIDPFQVNV